MTFAELLEALEKLGLLEERSADGELTSRFKICYIDPYRKFDIEAVEIRDNEIRFINDYQKYKARLGYE